MCNYFTLSSNKDKAKRDWRKSLVLWLKIVILVAVRRIYAIFSILLLAVWYNLEAKPYFRHLDARDGLPNPNVLAVCQDSLGRIWFGTENGVCYYDGGLHIVQAIGEVPHILCDASGTIWFISDGNLFRYTYPDTNLKLVLKDRADAICLMNGILHVISEKEDRYWNTEIQALSLRRLLPVDEVRSICVDHSGNTWITCPKGLILTPPTLKTVDILLFPHIVI